MERGQGTGTESEPLIKWAFLPTIRKIRIMRTIVPDGIDRKIQEKPGIVRQLTLIDPEQSFV